MPTAIDEGEVLELEVKGIADNQEILNVMHYIVRSIAGSPTLEDVVQGMVNLWTTIVAELSDSYDFTQVLGRRVTGIDPSTVNHPFTYDAQALSVLPSPVAGGVSGAALPTYVGASVRKVTSGVVNVEYISPGTPADPYTGEKVFRGSMRLGPIPETYTEAADQNRLTAAASAAMLAVVEDLEGLASSSGGGTNTSVSEMVVASRFLNQLGRADVALVRNVVGIQPVENLIINPFVGSQVSRKRRPSGI